ncbi:MAG: DUF2892 domain-containing protein [Pseudomonadota bacterium]
MIKNVGSIDKFIRLAIGTALVSQVFWGLQTLWGLIGLVLIGTAFMNFCPLYTALGMSTLAKKSGK